MQNLNPVINHVDVHKLVSLGIHISAEDNMIFAAVSSLNLLLNPAHAMEAKLQIVLNADGTCGFAKEFTIDLNAFVIPDCQGSYYV